MPKEPIEYEKILRMNVYISFLAVRKRTGRGLLGNLINRVFNFLIIPVVVCI